MVPVGGLESPRFHLQNGCSPSELYRREKFTSGRDWLGQQRKHPLPEGGPYGGLWPSADLGRA